MNVGVADNAYKSDAAIANTRAVIDRIGAIAQAMEADVFCGETRDTSAGAIMRAW
jgi:hypothetical protein